MLHHVLIASLVLSNAASPTAENEGPPHPFYDLDPVVDTIVTAGTLLLPGAFIVMVAPSLPGGPACDPTGTQLCDRSKLNALDRRFVTRNSTEWRRASDILLTASFFAPVLALGIEHQVAEGPRRSDYIYDLVILAQSIGVTHATTTMFKYAIRRPRPSHYVAGRDVSDINQQLSFPSGHTSMATAALTSYATTFFLRHPNSPWRWLVLGIAGATPIMMGVARVHAGRHFVTDVMAGATLGAALGFLIPMMHRRKDLPVVGVSTSPQGGAQLQLTIPW